jgi:hypothetical protein
MDLKQAAEALNANGFKARVFETAEEAKAAVLELVPAGAAVGVGGSVTVQQMGLREALMERGCAVHWHWYAAPEERAEAQKKAHDAGYYLMSSNAVTMEGELINIDGNCNRLGTMLYGPASVIVICGKNKLVEDPFKAIDRIKNVACPQNARRLKLSTPCAATGHCTDCRSPQRMCSATVRLQRPAGSRAFYVFLVNEDMGY